MASAALKIEPTKSFTSERDIRPVTKNLDENEIAALAYRLWLKRGCRNESDQEDWFKAECD